MYSFKYLLDIAGWRYVEDDGTEWMVGDRVTWEEPIDGGEYVTVIGTIYGFIPEEEAALVYIEEPFTGDKVEVRLIHLERIPRAAR